MTLASVLANGRTVIAAEPAAASRSIVARPMAETLPTTELRVVVTIGAVTGPGPDGFTAKTSKAY